MHYHSHFKYIIIIIRHNFNTKININIVLIESCYTIVEGESTMAVLRSTSESGLVCLYGGTWSLPEQADQIVWGALSYEARMNGPSCWATWRGGGEIMINHLQAKSCCMPSLTSLMRH